jgi:enterobactin synthetase component F
MAITQPTPSPFFFLSGLAAAARRSFVSTQPEASVGPTPASYSICPQNNLFMGCRAAASTRPDLYPSTIDTMAADYLQEIRAVQPNGPYSLLGWSLGGPLAYTIATQLQDQQESVTLLAMLDGYPPTQDVDLAEPTDQDIFATLIRTLLNESDELGSELVSVSSLKERLGRASHPMASLDDPIFQAIIREFRAAPRLLKSFSPRPFHGDLLFFRATPSAKESPWQSIEAWHPYIRGRIQVHDIACLHYKMMHPEPLTQIGPALTAALNAALSITPSSAKETVT